MRAAPLLRVAALTALAASTASAWAINVCTDAAGKTVYQDQPCPGLAPVAGNEPVAAKALTAAVVRDTVRRFQAALSARDVTTASRFLAPDLKVTMESATGTERYTRDSFLALLTQVLNAATVYETTARCGDVQVQAGAATVQCETSERVVVLKRSESGRATEQYRLVLNGGRAQFAEIVSRRH